MDAERKARLGTRWSCAECGVGFYDLGKPEALCPKCGTKQVADLPVKKKKVATKRPAGNYRRPLRERPAEVPPEDEVPEGSAEDDNGEPVDVDLDS